MRNLRSTTFRPYIALGIAIISLSFSAIFVRWANVPGAVSGFYRMAIALVILAAPFYRSVRASKGLPRRGVWIALLGGLLFAGDLAFWATGVMLSGASIPTLLGNTAPVWVGLGATFFFREKLNRLFWIGLLLSITSAAFILGFDTLRDVTFGAGALFGLLAGIFYGGYILITQWGRQSLGPLTYFWPAAASSTIALLILCFVLQQPLTGYSSNAYLNLFASGVVSQVIGYLAMNYVLGHLSASIVSPTLLGQPIITALLAVPLLGEQITQVHIIGGVGVIAGVYFVHRSRQRQSKDG